MNNCQYCEKEFSNDYSLKRHINTSKKCIEQRGEKQNLKFKCEFCDKFFSLKHNLSTHYETCSEKKIKLEKENSMKEINELKKIVEELKYKIFILEEQNKNMKEENKDLQEKLFSLAKQGMEKDKTTNVRNNVIQMLAPKNSLTPQMIEDIIDQKLTRNLLNQEEKGIANVISEINKTDDGKKFIVCSDYARKIFQSLDDEENVVKDPDAKNFLELVKDPITKVGMKVVKEYNISDDEDFVKAAGVLSRFKSDPTIVSNEFAKTCVI